MPVDALQPVAKRGLLCGHRIIPVTRSCSISSCAMNLAKRRPSAGLNLTDNCFELRVIADTGVKQLHVAMVVSRLNLG